MELKQRITKKVTITMSGEEASWLVAQLQNPLHGEAPDTENVFDMEMRYSFFTVLTSANNGGGS